MTAIQGDRLVTVRDTAAVLGCSVATVWRKVADKSIPQPVRIGGMTRWSETEIADFIEEAKLQREASSQRADPESNVERLTTSKEDVLDHYNRCRADFPIEGNSKVAE